MILADQMTPIEREAAMRAGRGIDRAPCLLFIDGLKCQIVGVSSRDYWFDENAMVQVEAASFRRWHHDRITLGPNSLGITEALGAPWEYPVGGMPQAGDPIVTDYAQLEAMEPAIPATCERLKPFFRAIGRLVSEFGNSVAVEASIGGPLTIAANLRGIEALLRDLSRRPEQVNRLLRLVVDTQKACIDAAAACGAGVAMADPVANPALIGAKRYERFVFPLTLELVEHARSKCERGVSLHMCGRTEGIWDCFKRYPLGLVSLDNAINLRRAAEELGTCFPIAGNVDPVGVIAFGTDEALRASVESCVAAGARSPSGFFLAPGCDVPLGVEARKIDLFMDACRRAGWKR